MRRELTYAAGDANDRAGIFGVFLASVTPVLPAVPPDVLQGWQAYTQRLRHATGTIRSVRTKRDGKEISTVAATVSFPLGVTADE